MKIEMGESLFYSWLRHVKECQLVQTNWKVSPKWEMQHEKVLTNFMEKASMHFSDKYGYKIFKQNASISQIIQQGECDAVGICIQNGKNQTYAVDVAFHENGLNYGSREETVTKIIAKSIRTAMCLYGYMDCSDAEIIFASPKIHPAIFNDATPCIEELNNLFHSEKFGFQARIIANDEFNSSVLQPTLLISNGVADTSELFLRSYQMFTMFSKRPSTERNIMYSQWFEIPTNNDRSLLPRPIEQHNATVLPTENINKNNQRDNGRTKRRGEGNPQWLHEMECLDCGNRYHALGGNVHERKCPNCQGGTPSL